MCVVHFYFIQHYLIHKIADIGEYCGKGHRGDYKPGWESPFIVDCVVVFD